MTEIDGRAGRCTCRLSDERKAAQHLLANCPALAGESKGRFVRLGDSPMPLAQQFEIWPSRS